MVTATDAPSILVVDPDGGLARTYAQAFAARGWSAVFVAHPAQAAARLRERTFDAVLADLAGDRRSLELLQFIEDDELELAVVVLGDELAAAAAARAAEGSFRCVLKPTAPETLVNVVGRTLQMHRLSQLRRDVEEFHDEDPSAREALAARFDRALERLWLAFQPIALVSERQIHGYEAFVRSDEPEMEEPRALFQAAARLHRLADLGREIRANVARAVERAPAGTSLFVNVHPAELEDPELFSSSAPLTAVAERVVIEITHPASLDGTRGVARRVARLRAAGFRVALDDLGSAHGGMYGLVQLEPDLVKLDPALVRGVDTSGRKRSVVRALLRLCGRELGMQIAAPGIETPTERAVLEAEGCDLMQGDLFAPPARDFAQPHWW